MMTCFLTPQDVVRVVVVLLFLGVFCASFAVTPQLDVGLEQDLSMPEDSYVLKYFKVSDDNDDCDNYTSM